ncbi:TIGR03503 family protein [Vibrio sp. SM6]|uniref:TIGR03503 family protein n=1 Tax=Vibrio agarilyticus TaxID=2726741 RepID=A0A7X8YH33_9VIBR|nr:TIGR03503 family protein [Vibrio agarilyticus]NLS13180.1 TIGR03503 family protein [Vibrio agarilyticus]
MTTAKYINTKTQIGRVLAVLLCVIGVFLSASHVAWAQVASSVSLLDNRFRVDPSIEQITFVIYREEASSPVVLVRPDGEKYYAWKASDGVRWHQESAVDIISIDDPMPGPWQAIGKVTPKNNVKLISHLALTTDTLPLRLYQSEQLKFNARLTSNGEPLVLRDFLDRVTLKITLTKFVENESSLVKEARPIPLVLGEFRDDGQDLDEKAGDGVFTVRLSLDVAPGKYRAQVVSGNGVFLRAQEQEVLVYPAPITTTFIQARTAEQEHKVIVSGEPAMVAPGSLLVDVVHQGPETHRYQGQGQAEAERQKVQVSLPNNTDNGQYAWSGQVFATEASSGRPLMFPISEQTYSVVEEVDLAKAQQERLAQIALEQERRLQQATLEAREDKRTRSLIVILLGNFAVILLCAALWLCWRKWQARKAAQPEMQLTLKK